MFVSEKNISRVVAKEIIMLACCYTKSKKLIPFVYKLSLKTHIIRKVNLKPQVPL